MLGPEGIGPVFEAGEVEVRVGRRVEGPTRFEAYAGFLRHVRLGDVGEDFFPTVLGEDDVDGGGLAAELDISDRKGSRAYFCTSWEFKMDGEGMRLVLFGMSGVEVCASDSKEARRDVATVRNCGFPSAKGLSLGIC